MFNFRNHTSNQEKMYLVVINVDLMAKHDFCYFRYYLIVLNSVMGMVSSCMNLWWIEQQF